ncbi:MAG: oligosaccharide flippase family protein [bacterium]|nr:oligosaccharide flippase family protein [bacterium]
MEQEQNHNLKKNSIISLLSLFFQSGYSAVLGLVANLVLTIVLAPSTFGIYTLVLSINSLLNYFSDIGLAASLVQKKDVTDDDFKTTFTVQQTLIITLITIGFFATSFITKYFNLPSEAVYLYWAVLASFFFSSLKTIPSIKLERSIQFQKIVLVQIVENTLFYISVSLLALAGFGLHSFTISVLIRSVIGTALIYSLSFWMPQIGISMKSLKKLLSFGVPFQTNTLLALVKDDLILLFLGKVLGLEALGYIGWAKRWAEAPIRIVMDNVNKILFPMFSRLQHEKEKVQHLLDKVIQYQTLILTPIYIGSFLLMHKILILIPKYDKWEPAIPLFYMFAIAAFFSSYSNPFTNLFNALGKIKWTFYFMIYWTVASWILIPILTMQIGINGFPVAQIALSLTFIPIVILARSLVPFQPWSLIIKPFIASIVMGIIVYALAQLETTWINVIGTVLAGGLSYLFVLYVIFQMNIIQDIRNIISYE